MPLQSNSLRKKLIFLGTPEVSAEVLNLIYKRANHALQIIAVVSQPPARSKRHDTQTPSPVHQLALELGIPVLTPHSAKEEDFLESIAKLNPDLCLTAAYGNFLPKRFLDIPKFGTLNIHPSLLPLYRGASPVQRSLENGDAFTGVTLLFSILEMDAGPIFLQEKMSIDENIKASDLLRMLFLKGGELFIRNFNKIFTKNFTPVEQDTAKATYAKKLSKEEGVLDFHQSAIICHNKIRAFDIWPKTTGKFWIDDVPKELKIITTEVAENTHNQKEKDIFINHITQTIDVCCGDNQILRIKELQEPGKRIMTAREYTNGLHGRKLICL